MMKIKSKKISEKKLLLCIQKLLTSTNMTFEDVMYQLGIRRSDWEYIRRKIAS